MVTGGPSGAEPPETDDEPTVEAPKKKDQGSREDPGGDLFMEALQDEEDEKKGISTIDQRL